MKNTGFETAQEKRSIKLIENLVNNLVANWNTGDILNCTWSIIQEGKVSIRN